MSDHKQQGPTLIERIRHWLWLDGTRRTDASEANRGFYPGLTRKPVGWRFFALVGSLGILIGLVIVSVRDTEARSSEQGEQLVFEEPGFAVTRPADWEVEIPEPVVWEPCQEVMWAVASPEADILDSMVSDLPAGPARPTGWTVDWRETRMPHSTCELVLAGARLRVVRGAESPPDDRWLSLAETIRHTRVDGVD